MAYLTTHNAMSAGEDRFLAPNQTFGVARQLADGVRALMLDTYERDGEPYLCHGDCGFGATPLAETLGVLRAFLEAHPREVVTLILEAYLSPEATVAAVEAAGLAPHLHTQGEGPWPTLGEMVEADRRLVVLTDRPGAAPWHHDVWDHAFETHFHVESADAFDCAPNRGDPAHPLFILNHFVTNPIAFIDFAREANARENLLDHAERCATAFGRPVTFVVVDFYEAGEALGVADRLNGVD